MSCSAAAASAACRAAAGLNMDTGLQGAFPVSNAMAIPQPSAPAYSGATGVPLQPPKLYGGVFGNRTPSFGLLPLGAPQPLPGAFAPPAWQQHRPPDLQLVPRHVPQAPPAQPGAALTA